MKHIPLATPPNEVLRRHGVVRIPSLPRHHLDTGPGKMFELHCHEKSSPVNIARGEHAPPELVLEAGKRVQLEPPMWLWTDDGGHADVDVREIAA